MAMTFAPTIIWAPCSVLALFLNFGWRFMQNSFVAGISLSFLDFRQWEIKNMRLCYILCELMDVFVIFCSYDYSGYGASTGKVSIIWIDAWVRFGFSHVGFENEPLSGFAILLRKISTILATVIYNFSSYINASLAMTFGFVEIGGSKLEASRMSYIGELFPSRNASPNHGQIGRVWGMNSLDQVS